MFLSRQECGFNKLLDYVLFTEKEKHYGSFIKKIDTAKRILAHDSQNLVIFFITAPYSYSESDEGKYL